MWIANRVIEYEGTEDEFRLYPIGDLQLGAGAKGVKREFIRWWVNKIASDPKGLAVFMGDIEDDDRPTTRIIKRTISADRPEVERTQVIEHLAYIDKHIMPLLEPLARKPGGVLAGVAGHHFTQISRKFNSTQHIFHRLSKIQGSRIHYLGEMSGWVWLRFRQRGSDNTKNSHGVKKLLHIQHGEGGGQAISTPINRLDRTAQSFEGDIFIRGHDCRKCAAKITKLYPKDSESSHEIKDREIALMNVGSATEGYVLSKSDISYPERAMMRPAARGWGIVHCYVRRMRAWEDPSQNMTVDVTCEI